MLTFTHPFEPVSPEAVNEFERRIGMKLPADYKRFLIEKNGGSFEAMVFSVPDGGDSLIDLLYGIRGEEHPCDIEREQANAQPLPKGFLVIGRNPGGCSLMLDTTSKTGVIYFWDRNGFFAKQKRGTKPKGKKKAGNTYQVASSFTKFLKALQQSTVGDED